jgi:hypothetical protein
MKKASVMVAHCGNCRPWDRIGGALVTEGQPIRDLVAAALCFVVKSSRQMTMTAFRLGEILPVRY